jgi:hypothetical protein
VVYVPVTWVDGVTPVNAANLNKMEDGIEVLDALPKIPTPLQEGKWLTVTGGAVVWAPAPVGGGVDYKGVWSAATAYVSGDVVNRNGIEYLAVNPGTNQTPPPASWAGPELAYAEFTAEPLSVTATSEATAHTIVTTPAVAFDGATLVMIEFWCPLAQPPQAAGSGLYIVLFEDAVSFGQITVGNNAAALLNIGGFSARRRRTPASGSHTYTAKTFIAGGSTGAVYGGLGGAGQRFPTFLRVVKA